MHWGNLGKATRRFAVRAGPAVRTAPSSGPPFILASPAAHKVRGRVVIRIHSMHIATLRRKIAVTLEQQFPQPLADGAANFKKPEKAAPKSHRWSDGPSVFHWYNGLRMAAESPLLVLARIFGRIGTTLSRCGILHDEGLGCPAESLAEGHFHWPIQVNAL